MQTAKTDLNEISADIYQLLVTIIRSAPQNAAAEVFDLLGRLDPEDKRQLWRWLDQRDRNLKQWLTNQGKQRRTV
ncbi:hypothetical protein [Phormidium tenue]|uniref:Uncharacterized protein n=1 Tax=Phormidium tenue NIES-30 TaxID=549789 RepID=A0A1U7IZQ4_9CYAN|nr:hypothetical protein [Phormidium tenue]MBD2234089.1 hypothetical protein [Phormidium tenue FACHB-1052]OKH44671.1 hypothetical protein NIES30_21910 [Phormidium tenue NIES-30]